MPNGYLPSRIHLVKPLGGFKTTPKKIADPFYSSPKWVSLRKSILIRDEYTCSFCNYKGISSELQVDHIIPRQTKGGKLVEYNPSNLRTLCRRCHTGLTFNIKVKPKPVIGPDGFPIDSTEWN